MMTTATDTATDTRISHLRAAVRAVMDHAIDHRSEFDADNAFDAIADVRANLTAEQLDDLPGMTGEIRQAYLEVKIADVTAVCYALSSWTQALDHAQDAMWALTENRWFSLVALRNLPFGISRDTLDMLLDQMECYEDIEVAPHDDITELPEPLRAALDEAAVEILGQKIHWMRFIEK